MHDKAGNAGHIAVEWLKLSLMIQLALQTAERAAEVRRSIGKSDLYEGETIAAELVSSFQVSHLPDKDLKVLTLHTAKGLRCDLEIPTDTHDPLGRPFHQALSEELLADQRD